jgi:hypothetical protein
MQPLLDAISSTGRWLRSPCVAPLIYAARPAHSQPTTVPTGVAVNACHSSSCRTRNLLLDVPPDKHDLISDDSVAALMRLRKNAGI